MSSEALTEGPRPAQEAKATARAHSNIALVKYWGKRDADLNLPTNGSISLTLDGMHTTTTVTWQEASGGDEVTLNGKPQAGEALEKVATFLERVRRLSGHAGSARVESHNNFPTAAGLASSASGFAALALAASSAAGLRLSPRELSVLARQGSGSASRSIFGGFVEWHRGEREDGLDSYAEPIAPGEAWDVRMLVCVLEPAPKPVSSRSGMTRTTRTSPMYPAWLETVGADLRDMRSALVRRDLERVGAIAEANCLKMHATMLTTLPAILYWQATTVSLMHRVMALRAEGTPCYFTIDAGPNVKVLCAPEDEPQVAAALGAVPGVHEVLHCRPGPGATLL